MERTNLIVAFILLMFVSSTILISEGRHLRSRNDRLELQTSEKHVLTGKSTHATVNSDQLAPEAPIQIVNAAQPPPPPPAGHLDNFRPTALGHSPGAGHSLQPQVSSEHMVKDARTTSDEKNSHSHAGSTFKTVNSDEVLPEAPSPIANASLPPQSPPPPARNMDGFQPTTPGHSPGAGHSIQN
uniref:Uncharacterized protein n=1 Tax=Kalanchoe fedtschenkoi TaxID=63787 RepID=A0A7N0T9Q0_KALFE